MPDFTSDGAMVTCTMKKGVLDGSLKVLGVIAAVALSIVMIFPSAIALIPGDGPCQDCIDITKYGAKANDGKEDTNAVHNAIKAAKAAGGGTVYFPSGTYDVNNIMNHSNIGPNITLKGAWGATLKLVSQDDKPYEKRFGIITLLGPHVPFTNFVVDGLIFDGNKANQDAGPLAAGYYPKHHIHTLGIWKNPALSNAVGGIVIKNSEFKNGLGGGLYFEGVSDITLENVKLINNGYVYRAAGGAKQVGVGDGVYVTGSNIVMKAITAKDNGDTSITLEGMYSTGTALIDGCNISGNSEVGLAIANNDYQAPTGRVASHDVVVKNCNISMSKRDLTVWETGTKGMQLEDYGGGSSPTRVLISTSKFNGADQFCLQLKGTTIEAANNILENCGSRAIYLSSGSYNIHDNTIKNTPVGIEKNSAASVMGITLTNNVFENVPEQTKNLIPGT